MSPLRIPTCCRANPITEQFKSRRQAHIMCRRHASFIRQDEHHVRYADTSLCAAHLLSKGCCEIGGVVKGDGQQGGNEGQEVNESGSGGEYGIFGGIGEGNILTALLR